MPGGHDTTIEGSNIMSFVLYTQILRQSVLKPASPGITLIYDTLLPHTGMHPKSAVHIIFIFYMNEHYQLMQV